MKTNITSRRRSSQILCLFEPSRGNCMILPHQVGMNLHTNGKEKQFHLFFIIPKPSWKKTYIKNLDVCVCVFTLIWLCLYLYISISLLISIYLYLYLHLLLTLIFISIPTFIPTFTYTSFPPVCFPKSRVAASVFFLNSTGTAPSTSLAFWFASAVDWKATAAESHGPGRFDPQKRTHLNQPTPRKFQENIRLLLVSLEGFFHHGKLHPWDLSGSCKGCVW